MSTPKIILSLDWQEDQALAKTQVFPLSLSSLLLGKDLSEVPRILALAHPLSPKTHAIAAKMAIAAALGEKAQPSAKERFFFFLEMAREQGVYFLIQLPKALGINPPSPLLGAFRKVVLAKNQTVLADHLDKFLQAMLESRWQHDKSFSSANFFDILFQAISARFLPPLQKPLMRWLQKRKAFFCRLPQLLTYQSFYNVRTLAQQGGVGKAYIHGARGLIVHAVTIKRGQLIDYGLNTPTLRHFNESGAWTKTIGRQSFQSFADAQDFAKFWALVLDPCMDVECTVPKNKLPGA